MLDVKKSGGGKWAVELDTDEQKKVKEKLKKILHYCINLKKIS